MDEEEVIERLKQTIQLDKEVFGQNSKNFEIEEILLNYIDKLEKDNYKLDRENQALYETNNCNDKEMLIIQYEMLKGNSIDKQLIRNKITELIGEIHRTKKGRIILKDIKRLAKIEVLKELLGE